MLTKKSKIIRNAAVCKACGDFIESKYRHDFVTCSCGAISLDGGTDYQKGTGEYKNFDFDKAEAIIEDEEANKRGG